MKNSVQMVRWVTLALLLGVSACRRSSEPAPAGLQAQEPLSATMALSTNQIHVGENLLLTLEVVHPKAGQLQVPEISNGKELVARDRQVQEESLSDASVRTRMQYKITSYVVGQHTLSSGEVVFAQSDGKVLRQPMPFATFEVASVLTNGAAEFQDIKGLAQWPAAFPRWLVVLLLVALLALIAAWAVKRFLSKPRTILNMPPPPPPHETALQALRHLLSKGWIEALNIEPFYVELSNIVRHYLEDRFQLRAPELTTEEFIREASSSHRLSEAHQQLTLGFLEQSDLVKFARHQPSQQDMKTAYSSAETLVRETIPVVPTSEGRAAS